MTLCKSQNEQAVKALVLGLEKPKDAGIAEAFRFLGSQIVDLNLLDATSRVPTLGRAIR